jgi:clan AA aspartic protease (TIGR02281 family)
MIYFRFIKILILLAIPLFCKSQANLSASDFMHINALYADGQYNVVVNLLANLGFNLEKSVQDYSLDGVAYTGNFSFVIKTYNYEGLNTSRQIWSFESKHEDSNAYVESRIKVNFQPCPFSEAAIIGLLEAKIGGRVKRLFGTIIARDTTFHYGENEFGEWAGVNNCFGMSFEIDQTSLWADLSYKLMKHPIPNPILPTLAELNNDQHRILDELNGVGSKTVQLKKDKGLYIVKVSIGGKEVNYILDSGASEMSINKSMEEYLKSIGSIRASDYLPSGSFSMADGSTKEFRRVKLASVNVGELVINLVSANIVADGQPLLLGKSFLDRFSSWKINNEKQLLELGK